MKALRLIIAGGGTGGHIFPAISVANAVKKIYAPVEILFVGAKGKMEMEKVPQAGFNIEGIDIAGFNRSQLWKNWSLPFKLLMSFIQVRKIFKSFQPDAVFGVGGYSSFPVLRYAQKKHVPNFLHEANSFAGKANIMLGKNATKVMVATKGMERFFPKNNMMHTGNPVRSEITHADVNIDDAFEYFGLKQGLPTVLIMGGSMGARSINHAMVEGLSKLIENNIQVIWQTGKGNLELIDQKLRKNKTACITEFISKMNYAYAVADLVVSRAGAIAIAEICATGKAAILVPYPLAAEDHQTANAKQLVNQQAALLVPDSEAQQKLIPVVLDLIKDSAQLQRMHEQLKPLGIKDADQRVATEILKWINA